MMYSKYLVKDTDRFNPDHFPAITEDLDVIIASMTKSLGLRNSEMLVSFARHHRMEADWVEANPALAEMISSKSLPLTNLEALFASSGKNLSFCQQLEEYVLNRFETSAASSIY
jgi:hypothetical protein